MPFSEDTSLLLKKRGLKLTLIVLHLDTWPNSRGSAKPYGCTKIPHIQKYYSGRLFPEE
jgi:hypothetical protein